MTDCAIKYAQAYGYNDVESMRCLIKDKAENGGIGDATSMLVHSHILNALIIVDKQFDIPTNNTFTNGEPCDALKPGWMDGKTAPHVHEYQDTQQGFRACKKCFQVEKDDAKDS